MRTLIALIIFRTIIVEAIHFCTVRILTQHRTYQDVFEARKVTQFLRFRQLSGTAIIRQLTEPFKMRGKVKTSQY